MKLDIEMLAAGLGAAASLNVANCPARAVPTARSSPAACRTAASGSCSASLVRWPKSQQPTHRFGVAYEAQVYDQLLPAWRDDVPRLHGAFLDETTQTIGLALDYLDGATPLQQVSQPKAGLMAAARWIARFHRWSETAAVPSFLHRYDTEFYRVWMQRAGHFTRRLHERLPLAAGALRALPASPACLVAAGDDHSRRVSGGQHSRARRPQRADRLGVGRAGRRRDRLGQPHLGLGRRSGRALRAGVLPCPLARRHARRFCLAADRRPRFLASAPAGRRGAEEGLGRADFDVEELLPLAERLS